jgi:cobalt-zinc-cadmium resistance protein CzcA
VRNRDLQSVVTDIQKIVNTEIKLPPGYYVQYGGQFENLQSAKARLMVCSLALFLILILLYLWINKSFNGVFSNTTFCSGRVLFYG